MKPRDEDNSRDALAPEVSIGTRPTCHRCSTHGFECEWDTEPETTRRQALLNRAEDLEKENEDLHELIRYLYSRPESEALEIFHRLRATGDAFHVLDLVRMGDLLLKNLPNEKRGSGSEQREDTRQSSAASSKPGSSRDNANEGPDEAGD
ncbi:hypothetical protein LZ32DRAFT_659266 [Colletotrichum eremochloae]|nr:hypothetical protein LZ32DRAFT_659266 [Colletotrichum eremochloae]